MYIKADHPYLQYSGRIDDRDPETPVWVFPCTSVRIRFRGTQIGVFLRNRRVYWDNYLGVILDGVQTKLCISEETETAENPSGARYYELASGLADAEHELLLFKRQDGCHEVAVCGFTLNDGAELLPPPARPPRRIEVYGDSVSAGEVSEAVDYTGKPDPEHNGEYSNSWYSYAWLTARKLGAELHDIAQGGIALLDGTGWFAAPQYVGMETAWNKVHYNPELPVESAEKNNWKNAGTDKGKNSSTVMRESSRSVNACAGKSAEWDFSRYTPHVVIVAIGQNDSHPDDYMKDDPHGERAANWKRCYRSFLERLRDTYPNALIILSTTVLQHDEHWDLAIDEVCRAVGDPKIVHFLYRQNGRQTPGHIRIGEAEQMAEELASYIERFGETIWR